MYNDKFDMVHRDTQVPIAITDVGQYGIDNLLQPTVIFMVYEVNLKANDGE